MTRKFKFVGDPNEYTWEPKPIKGKVYNGHEELNGFMPLESTLKMARNQDKKDRFLKDWEEVFQT